LECQNFTEPSNESIGYERNVAVKQLLKLADPKYRIMVEVEQQVINDIRNADNPFGFADKSGPIPDYKKQYDAWELARKELSDYIPAGYHKVIPLSEWLEGKE